MREVLEALGCLTPEAIERWEEGAARGHSRDPPLCLRDRSSRVERLWRDAPAQGRTMREGRFSSLFRHAVAMGVSTVRSLRAGLWLWTRGADYGRRVIPGENGTG